LIERDNPYWDDLYPNLVGMNRKLPDWVLMGRRDKPGDDDMG